MSVLNSYIHFFLIVVIFFYLYVGTSKYLFNLLFYISTFLLTLSTGINNIKMYKKNFNKSFLLII